jgi:urease accessory protein
MIIKEKIGNLSSFNIDHRTVDRVAFEWYEVNKRILHKRTQSGKEIVLKFMKETTGVTEDDVLWCNETSAIVVDIQACEAICIQPSTMQQVAAVCYEIGNKHLPLFYHNNELLVPFEAPLFKMLAAAGYEPKRENRKLVNQLKTTVTPRSIEGNKASLFSKILQLTTSSPDANY